MPRKFSKRGRHCSLLYSPLLRKFPPEASHFVKMADSETLAAAAPSSSLEENTGTDEELMPDAKNPSEGSDSESESDSDSEDESQAKAQIEALEAQLYTNPSDYDSHVQVNNFFCHFTVNITHASTPLCVILGFFREYA